MMRRTISTILNWLSLLLASPCAATVLLSSWVGLGETEFFRFWTHFFAIIPGLPGAYLRRAFYRMTLDHCASDCHIGFGALFAHREARVEQGVYIGNYALCGRVHLHNGCLIGCRASLLSGKNQHQFSEEGKWLSSNLDDFVQIHVGEHAWIGEAAVLMADVGNGSAVSAGSVVSEPLPDYVVVAGNPARFVRRLVPAGLEESIPKLDEQSRSENRCKSKARA